MCKVLSNLQKLIIILLLTNYLKLRLWRTESSVLRTHRCVVSGRGPEMRNKLHKTGLKIGLSKGIN